MIETEAPNVVGNGRWIGDPNTFHGEGAFWDERAGALRHVDMLAGDVITWNGSETTRTDLGDVVALLRRRAAGGFVAATERGFALLDEELAPEREIGVFTSPALRMNEGGCDPRGRLFCGSMAYSAAPGAGSLYRLDASLEVATAMEGVTVPNGLVWTGGGSVALHADTPDATVYRYDYDLDAGTFGGRDVFIDLTDAPGLPDGIALDDRGGLWIALWGGASVRRYDAQGRHTDTIDLDVTNPTSCAFGGADGRTLFVTTSNDGLGGRAEDAAGLVFAVDTRLRGAPVHEFAD